MIRLRTFTVLAIGVVLVLAGAACDSITHVTTDLCQDDMDCPATMHCDPATHLCVECLEDEHCPAPWRCDRAPAICVECLEDEDCRAGRCIEKECVAIEQPPEPEEEPSVAPEPEEEPTPEEEAQTPEEDAETPEEEAQTPEEEAQTPEEPTPEPVGAVPTEVRAAIVGFAEQFSADMASGNVDGLLETLAYPVFLRYNTPQCRTELERVIVNPVHIEVLEVTWIGTWIWTTDGLSTELEHVYTVLVRFTAGGETWEQWIHLIVLPDLSVWWLTDCGTPPTPTLEPAAAAGSITGFAPAGDGPQPYSPEAYLVLWPEGATAPEAVYLEPTCRPSCPEEALDVYLGLVQEWGSTPVDQGNGAFAFHGLPWGTYTVLVDFVLCPDGSWSGIVGSTRTSVSSMDPVVSVELTEQIYCSCD
jgi:hypothetical protein